MKNKIGLCYKAGVVLGLTGVIIFLTVVYTGITGQSKVFSVAVLTAMAMIGMSILLFIIGWIYELIEAVRKKKKVDAVWLIIVMITFLIIVYRVSVLY